MVIYVTNLDDSSYKEFTSNGLVLIDIHALWCGPCKAIGPIIDDISSDYFEQGLKVGKVDADKCPETIALLGVRSIPTIILLKDGEIVEKTVGMTTKENLSNLIEQYL
jgi:thioredoxin 1